MTVLNGRFTKEAMVAALGEVCRAHDIPAADAELLRLTNNAVFALPSAGIVVRIARTGKLLERVRKVVELATWLAERDAPSNRLVTGIGQPIPVGDTLATIWEYLPTTEPTLTPADLGITLRRFHALDLPDFPLTRWDPVGDSRKRIEDAEGLSTDDRDFLLTWCDSVDEGVQEVLQGQDAGLVHGDAHVGNLLRKPDGQVVLCDFDATALGPWQADLVAVAVGEQRFRGRTGASAVLAESYGYDVTTDPVWPVLKAARELKMVAAGAPLLQSGAGVAEEFRIRLCSIRDDHQATKWTPFAEVS